MKNVHVTHSLGELIAHMAQVQVNYTDQYQWRPDHPDELWAPDLDWVVAKRFGPVVLIARTQPDVRVGDLVIAEDKVQGVFWNDWIPDEASVLRLRVLVNQEQNPDLAEQYPPVECDFGRAKTQFKDTQYHGRRLCITHPQFKALGALRRVTQHGEPALIYDRVEWVLLRHSGNDGRVSDDQPWAAMCQEFTELGMSPLVVAEAAPEDHERNLAYLREEIVIAARWFTRTRRQDPLTVSDFLIKKQQDLELYCRTFDLPAPEALPERLLNRVQARRVLTQLEGNGQEEQAA